ncbi:hypothetical protein PAXRUDRAFT_157101, partial [Paxillus rubicundulus Ve08.2h10]
IAVINDQGFLSPAVANLSVSLAHGTQWAISTPQQYSSLPPLFYPEFMASLADTTAQPMILKSGRAAGKEAKSAQIWELPETCIRPADLLDVEYASFINSMCHFFLLDGLQWCQEPHGRHQLVVHEEKWYRLIKEAHNDLRHKGVFTVCTGLLLRFWWPMLVEDVKWYIHTCHECQICQTQKLHIPPSMPAIGGLFQKAHIDTMQMPKAGGFHHIVQAHCHWPLLFLRISSADWALFLRLYNIHHIHISPYNSQGNIIIEQRHYDACEVIIKSAEGDESRWYRSAHSVFWAEWVTIIKSTGLSPYFITHGIELLFPFDLSEATYLVPLPDMDPLSTTGLITWHACQKCWEDLDAIHSKVLKARFLSIKQFEETFKNWIKDYDFPPGSLVLIWNLRVKKELNWKTKPWYTGPMIVLFWTTGGLYLLAELDGSVSKLWFAAFQLLPYHPHSTSWIAVTTIMGLDEEALDHLAGIEDEEPDNEGQAFNNLP